MFAIFHDINWMLIGALIVVSALVSWAGDVIGMKLGKKRITLLKLRPKYTSRIISVITGVAIAVATIFVLSMASEQVRTALFSMQVIQRQLVSAREELRKNEETIDRMEYDLFQSRGDLSIKEEELRSKQFEVAEIERKLADGAKNLEESRSKLAKMTLLREKTEKEHAKLQKINDALTSESKKLASEVEIQKQSLQKLKENIKHLRTGRIAAFSGEILAQGILDNTAATIRQNDIDSCVQKLRDEVRAMLAYRFGKKSPDVIDDPIVSDESIKNTSNLLKRTPGRWILRLTADGNAVENEIVRTKLSIYHSKLIYKTGDKLAQYSFTPNTQREEIERIISSALKQINQRAVSKGVLKDPITGTVGSIDTEDLNLAVNSIMKIQKKTELIITAKKDIYSEGPVHIKLNIVPES